MYHIGKPCESKRVGYKLGETPKLEAQGCFYLVKE
nr:MAG TPA: hypothetical protein [Caudoviricetes sp.]